LRRIPVPIAIAVSEGFRRILAVGLMAGAEIHERPSSWTELVARTLQLSLHQRLLSDFERLRMRARIVVICPITPPDAFWNMNPQHVASADCAVTRGGRDAPGPSGKALSARPAIHYLDLASDSNEATKTIWLADAL
jgi:hypothetical protein